MPIDIRSEGAKYYDIIPCPFNDVDFYRSKIPSRESSLLEAGCGAGRVLIPLASHCGFILGVDSSEAMLEICRKKLKVAGIPTHRARLQRADITAMSLGRTFDLIIAPFRLFENLEFRA